MIEIDVTRQIKQLDGQGLTTSARRCPACGQPVGKVEAMTVRTVATSVLTANLPDERDLSGAKKVERYHLALRFIDSTQVELKAEEVVLLKMLVGKMYGPLVVGQMWEVLEGQ